MEKGYKLYENIEISDVHSAGRSIAAIGNRNIYIDFAMPGDVADIKVAKRQKGFSIGTINSLIQASPDRVRPFCRHFGVCGGCNWQHFSYASQLHWKKQILQNALAKYEIKTPPIENVITSPQQHFYRNKLDFAFTLNENGKISCGFHPAGNPAEVFPVTECFLLRSNTIALCAQLCELLEAERFEVYNFTSKSGQLRNLTIRCTTTGEQMFILGLANENIAIIEKLAKIYPKVSDKVHSFCYTEIEEKAKGEAPNPIYCIGGNPIITERMNGFTFEISPASFYQPNPEQAANLYACIKQFANLTPFDFAYDLYTGTGTIACYLASGAKTIMGIEGTPEAILNAQNNAARNHLNNVQFRTGDILKTFTPLFLEKYGFPQVIILDPPRSGTLIEIKKTILASGAQRVVYVSCNPVSLAWDLKQLCEGYNVTAIQAFDMFPHTHHVETVVLLEKKQ